MAGPLPPFSDELLRALDDEASRRGVSVESVLHALLDATGATAEATSATTDEADLQRQTTEMLATVVEHYPEPVARFDRNLRYTFVNAVNLTVTGLREHQMLGHTLREIGATESLASGMEAALTKAFETGESQRFSFDFNSPAGWRYFESTLIPEADKHGNIVSVLVVSHETTAQRELEDKLRERETWFRGIVESQVDLVSRYTRDLTLVFVNDAYCKYFGGTPESFIGRSILELEDPKVHDTLRAHVEQMVHDPTPRVNEILSYWPDGSERWIQWVTCAVKMEEGGARLFQAVGRDITAQRQLERQLRERESWYRGIVESQIDLVSRQLPDTTLVFVNDAYCKYYGFTREELIGKSFLITEPPIVHDSLRKKLAVTLDKPGPHIEENLSYHPDGRERWVQWMSYAFADDDGNVTMIQSVGRDITEQKQAERIRYENEERFRAMLEAAAEGIALIDADNRLIQVNRYIEQRFGYTRGELIGQLYETLIHPDSRDAVQTAIEQTRLSGENYGMQFAPPPMAQAASGATFPVEMTFAPLSVSGQPMTMCLLIDITERQQLEEQRVITRALEVELAKERELIDLKQRFMTMITHEFRTPLAIIQSTIDIVQNYLGKLPMEKLSERLETVTKQAKRMSELVSDVLTYNRGTHALQPSTLELIDLGSFCRAVINDLRMADNDAHPITLEIRNPPVMLHTDRRLLEHIVINLIGNAIKYSPTNCQVSVTVSREGTQLVLVVTDTGIGIPESDLPRIYTPFHRAANVGARSGSGLGLPIVKQCVDALNGTIDATSRVGHGTTFTVRLPETMSTASG